MDHLVTAIIVSIQMCMSGPMTPDGSCLDGAKPFEAKMHILEGRSGELNCIPTKLDLAECHAEWTALMRIERDGKNIFVLRPDGSVESTDQYRPSAAAMVFYRGLKAALENNQEFRQ